jgi:hypothetical protein
VLIAIAILSTAIIFIFRSFTVSLSSAKFSHSITLASLLAEEKIWEIETSFKEGTPLPLAKPEIRQNRSFEWKSEIMATDIAKLKLLKLSIFWKENVREKPYALEFFTYLAQK